MGLRYCCGVGRGMWVGVYGLCLGFFFVSCFSGVRMQWRACGASALLSWRRWFLASTAWRGGSSVVVSSVWTPMGGLSYDVTAHLFLSRHWAVVVSPGSAGSAWRFCFLSGFDAVGNGWCFSRAGISFLSFFLSFFFQIGQTDARPTMNNAPTKPFLLL